MCFIEHKDNNSSLAAILQFLQLVEARRPGQGLRADLGAGEDVGDEVGRDVLVVVAGQRRETVEQEDSALDK